MAKPRRRRKIGSKKRKARRDRRKRESAGMKTWEAPPRHKRRRIRFQRSFWFASPESPIPPEIYNRLTGN
jgi:hypothetical protein